ncbi:hypothetical protein EI555_015153, partial [Monodon monoceros]
YIALVSSHLLQCLAQYPGYFSLSVVEEVLALSKIQLINQPWTVNLYLIISIIALVKKGNLSKIVTWMPNHHSLFGCEWLLHLSFGTAKTYSSLYCLRR